MLFEIEFINQGVHFLYSFEVMTKSFEKGNRRIVSEMLWINHNNKMMQIFERDLQRITS